MSLQPDATFVLVPEGQGLALRRTGRTPPTVEALMIGRSVDKVRHLLPAFFGLCRSVQELALALALDLPERPDPAALRHDLMRDHLAKLCLHLPHRLGLPPLPLPAGWAEGGAELREALFGQESLPAPAALPEWLVSGAALAPLVAAVAAAFVPGEAITCLPPLDEADPLAPRPVENSLAQRHRAHPLLLWARAHRGHGPLAHLMARLVDLEALSRGDLPTARRLPDGTALVPCSRGLCALRMRTAGGMVTGLLRRTPTDHLLAPEGGLAAALRRLTPARAGLAPLLIDLMDPCVPVRVADHA